MKEKYISVNRAILVLKEKCEQGLIDFATADAIAGFIDKQPAADVQEVKHGKFISEVVKKEDWKGKIQEYYQPNSCSNCHTALKGTENYCPNCGVKMDGE